PPQHGRGLDPRHPGRPSGAGRGGHDPADGDGARRHDRRGPPRDPRGRPRVEPPLRALSVMDPVVDIALRPSLALLFPAAALDKVRDLRRFRATVAAYRLVPVALADPLAVAVVGVEVAVATALVFPHARDAGLAGAACLLVLYAGAVGVNVARGRRDLECG